MDSKSSNPGLQVIAWAVFLLGLAVAGCQLLVPRQDWSEKKWGPLVPHTKFPGDCSICHIPERWDKLRDDFSFDHEKETGYPLEGGHASAACLRCHNDRGPVEVYAARGCAGCHLDPHASTLGMDCERCHSQISWEPTGLIGEHARTRFPLVGAHAIAACDSCHDGAAAGDFRGAPLECSVCHQGDAARTTDPNHLANGWVSCCQQCHNPVGWNGANILHNFFPLSGGHGGLNCVQCHTTPGEFSGLSQDCYSCHSSDFQSAPGHVDQNFSHDCTTCHSRNGWRPANFNHSFFPLTGEHAGLSCTECHSGGTYTGLSSDCYSCHNTDYQGAPDHAAQSYPQTCEQCHSTSGWAPATFDHASFALTGAHAGATCAQCHSSGIYAGLPSNCYSCHDTDYQGAPDHVALNFPQNCEECHSTTAWTPAAIDHSFFPLTQGHTGLNCTQCHTGGSYSGLSPECYSCHSTDFQGAPDHAALNFSHDCEQCHTRSAWTPATFDHSFFSLTGGHSGLTCMECHSGGGYSGLTPDCYSCHDADFQTAPDHASLGFPHDCTGCHTINAWTPASYQHDFPLSGNHNTSCTTCHDSGSTQNFTCFNCHAHRQSEADSEHREVSGYSYNSQACYNCHPNGRH